MVVTPNKRLARRLAELHDAAQRAAGRTVWPAATVVPWTGWLERLWLDVMAAGCRPDPPRLVTSGQSAHLWAGIVAAEAPLLIDARGAAALAAEAWSLVFAWGSGGPSWRAWAGSADDCAQFARWADSYARALARIDGLDASQLADWLAGCAAEVPAWRGVAVTLAGFIELAPQQERLLAALAAAGMRIDRASTLPEAGPAAPVQTRRVAASTPHDELACALEWARDLALADPAATIGIAIEDLASRREEVRTLAEEILCPALQWPGGEDAARPYNLSLGIALADVPLVAAALDLVALAHGPLPAGRAAALLRSPYLAGASGNWPRRARVEVDWLEHGRRQILLDEAIAALGIADRAGAGRWREARDALRTPASATPREWSEVWRAWLAALGWPGERTLSSAEWQARGAWDELLAQFAMLAPVAKRLSRADAAPALAALASGRVFQPETPPAPVQILGLLEAAGLPLDALWVAGLAAENWPPAPQPNPLLPPAWQRDHGVPRSSAARELGYAQALTTQWARAAPQVVFSCARRADDRERSPSALVPAAPMQDAREAAPTTARRQFQSAPTRETVADDRAPPLPAGSSVRGGAALIEAQSDCPFRAVASHRLAVATWPEPLDGLSAMERGSLVHAAMAAFWRATGDHAALIAFPPDALAARIDAAVADATATLPAARWRRLPAVVRAGEAARIAVIVGAWLENVDRARPPFAVTETEASRPLALGGLALRLRLDRIDTLADGGIAIIDYKTGAAKAPARWFDARLQAPQLGLYLLAQQAQAPAQPVRAVAYAQLKPGLLTTQGIAADPAAWPALAAPAAIRGANLADWAEVEARWREGLAALANEVREGRAPVAPRDVRATCRQCGLQALCRIGALSVADGAGDGDE